MPGATGGAAQLGDLSADVPAAQAERIAGLTLQCVPSQPCRRRALTAAARWQVAFIDLKSLVWPKLQSLREKKQCSSRGGPRSLLHLSVSYTSMDKLVITRFVNSLNQL